MRRYNDYELIYLVQSENCEIALTKLIDKYKLLIFKILYLFNVKEVFFDDYVQESHMLMYDIIIKFDESKGKTFTRFYEFVLKRRILYLKSKEPKYENYENFDMYKDESEAPLEIDKSNLTELEKGVYQRYFVENQSINFIAKVEERSNKQIYNAIYRIKDKYKNNML